MRHMTYFATRSNFSFDDFPKLLATVDRCNVDLGKINHSRRYIVTYLKLLNEVLIESTSDWLQTQENDSVTITLDIGTCSGISFLAVLFISKGKVKLANILPVISKARGSLAQLCIDALLLEGNVEVNVLMAKIAGVVGDGAFMKSNKPFKDMMSKILQKQLTFRWDLLHLANRAHITARGGILSDQKYDKKYGIGSSDSIMESNDTNDIAMNSSTCTSISRTIDYIQSQAKKYRTGIKYTELRISTASLFKRPKIWSTTRMCLYEFDMVHRFLQNKMYFENPTEFVVLSQMYCLVMRSVKIMLKQAQKVDITHQYVNKVIREKDCFGEVIMKYCLKRSVDILVDGTSDFKDWVHDILGEPVTIKEPSSNTFISELKKFVISNLEIPTLENDRDLRDTSHTLAIQNIIESCRQVIEDYLNAFCIEMRERFQYTDFSSGST